MTSASEPQTRAGWRAAAIGGALSLALAVHAAFAPRIAEASRAFADADEARRIDAALESATPRLLAERAALRLRLGSAVDGDAQARLLDTLDAVARRRGVRILSTARAEAADDIGGAALPPGFTGIAFEVQLHGSYRSLLPAIADLSRGTALVRVSPPVLERAGDMVTATVPLALVARTASPGGATP